MRKEKITRLCVICGDTIPKGRAALKYYTCLPCGELEARMVKHCIVPMHKSNYFVCTDPADLHGINNKGGIIK